MTVSVNTAGVERLVRTYARDKAEALADRFVEVARGFAPRRTGTGADSIEAAAVAERGGGFTVEVTVGETYMKYQNEGTGIYGPDGSPIEAGPGGVLVFDWPAAGGLVFARHVRGTEATHWWDRAVLAWPQIVGDA